MFLILKKRVRNIHGVNVMDVVIIILTQVKNIFKNSFTYKTIQKKYIY